MQSRFSPRWVISKELNTFSHKDEMLADPLSVHGIRGIYRMTTDYIGMENMPSFDEFADIYGKMAINGFEICDDMGQNRYINFQKIKFFLIFTSILEGSGLCTIHDCLIIIVHSPLRDF